MRGLIFLLCASLAFAQLDSNSVTVTVAGGTLLQPDQVVFGVVVDSDMNASLSDAVTPLENAGITLSSFTGVRMQTQAQPLLEWTFILPVALNKLADTVAALTSAQQSAVQNNTGLAILFGVQSTQISQELAQSRTCPFADLLSAARTQAEKLAGGAGMNPGRILAMQSSTLSPCSVTVAFALQGSAQSDPGSITISAIRSITLQPDQVIFAIGVTAPLRTGLDQVLASVRPLGITAANFQDVNTLNPATLQWDFTFAVPLSDLNSTIASLQSMAQSLSLTFGIAGVHVSPELQASQQCSPRDLVSDAQGQAQKLAAAAGLKVGSVQAIANAPLGFSSSPIGIPDSFGGSSPSAFIPPSPPVTCSATVKFSLAP